ncbi:hypothetical protein HNY73_011461 [Argiope bruennichi]|uniref:Uncharacterized protein n=1 Tax=Argiope bruennichi TaxID=94029 RepID=A0A8T0F562_ARGBR|nr:hypothetical protein HNY73_011461 [Argiope bruennichi]
MHSGGNLDTCGVQKVEAAAESKRNLIYSYTNQPVMSAAFTNAHRTSRIHRRIGIACLWILEHDINLSEVVPEAATFQLKKIPPGATAKVQPLDVAFVRSWKQFARRVSDRAVMEGGVDIFQSNNIIKLQSLVHFQFSAPQYSDMIRYAWFKSWLLQIRPPNFKHLCNFVFSRG